MEQIKVLTYDNLDLIKDYIDAADAKSIKSIALDGNKLKFYKVSEPVGSTAPVYEIELPDTDISGLLEKLTTTNVGNVVVTKADGTVEDGNVALADLAKQDDLDTLEGTVEDHAELLEKLDGDDATEGSIKKQIKDAVDVVDGKVGDLAGLNTTAKTDLVNAINEVRSAVEVGGTGSQVTIDSSVTESGMVKTYVFKQGTTEIGKVNVPLDLVVSGGAVVVDPAGQPAGTYIELTIANQADPIYISVADLVDAYTAQASAAQVQLVVSDTNEISATIVAGSIGTTELADGAINTAKIADANVTLAKLGADVTPTLTQVATNKTNIEALEDRLDDIIAITPEEINAIFTA